MQSAPVRFSVLVALAAVCSASGWSPQSLNVRSTEAGSQDGRPPIDTVRPRGTTTTIWNGWNSYGRDAQHSARSAVRSDPLASIHWQTPVDLNPQLAGNGGLLIHYGSLLVTAHNTVIVPVKTGDTGGFRVDAREGTDGTVKWFLSTDYIPPPHSWYPVFGPVLTPAARLYFPGAGGTVYFREQADSVTGTRGQIAFYGLANYQADPSDYNNGVMINTPLTSDSAGNIFFGFLVIGGTPLNLTSGIARISPTGAAMWTPVTTAAADVNMTEVEFNCAPALSPDGRTLYLVISDPVHAAGYLVALDSATLAPQGRERLRDPNSGRDALLSNNSSASPTVGPDGDVYFGVLENPSPSNHFRGWLLHFDASLSQVKTPGAFGWDDTAGVVPASMVPSYSGTSPYLLMTKYNNYVSAGGDGRNRLAILDPNGTQSDPVTGATVMNEVLTILGPTPDGPFPAVKEWCINSAAVDPASKSILANSEDGRLYRWDLSSNTLSESIALTLGLFEAYTPTAIGVDGTVYAINNATLFAVGR